MFQTNFDKLIQTIETENSISKDIAEKRIDEATAVIPQSSKSKPKKTNKELTDDDKDRIESALNKILNQLEICTKSTSKSQTVPSPTSTFIHTIRNSSSTCPMW